MLKFAPYHPKRLEPPMWNAHKWTIHKSTTEWVLIPPTDVGFDYMERLMHMGTFENCHQRVIASIRSELAHQDAQRKGRACSV